MYCAIPSVEYLLFYDVRNCSDSEEDCGEDFSAGPNSVEKPTNTSKVSTAASTESDHACSQKSNTTGNPSASSSKLGDLAGTNLHTNNATRAILPDSTPLSAINFEASLIIASNLDHDPRVKMRAQQEKTALVSSRSFRVQSLITILKYLKMEVKEEEMAKLKEFEREFHWNSSSVESRKKYTEYQNVLSGIFLFHEMGFLPEALLLYMPMYVCEHVDMNTGKGLEDAERGGSTGTSTETAKITETATDKMIVKNHEHINPDEMENDIAFHPARTNGPSQLKRIAQFKAKFGKPYNVFISDIRWRNLFPKTNAEMESDWWLKELMKTCFRPFERCENAHTSAQLEGDKWSSSTCGLEKFYDAPFCFTWRNWFTTATNRANISTPSYDVDGSFLLDGIPLYTWSDRSEDTQMYQRTFYDFLYRITVASPNLLRDIKVWKYIDLEFGVDDTMSTMRDDPNIRNSYQHVQTRYENMFSEFPIVRRGSFLHCVMALCKLTRAYWMLGVVQEVLVVDDNSVVTSSYEMMLSPVETPVEEKVHPKVVAHQNIWRGGVEWTAFCGSTKADLIKTEDMNIVNRGCGQTGKGCRGGNDILSVHGDRSLSIDRFAVPYPLEILIGIQKLIFDKTKMVERSFEKGLQILENVKSNELPQRVLLRQVQNGVTELEELRARSYKLSLAILSSIGLVDDGSDCDTDDKHGNNRTTSSSTTCESPPVSDVFNNSDNLFKFVYYAIMNDSCSGNVLRLRGQIETKKKESPGPPRPQSYGSCLDAFTDIVLEFLSYYDAGGHDHISKNSKDATNSMKVLEKILHHPAIDYGKAFGASKTLGNGNNSVVDGDRVESDSNLSGAEAAQKSQKSHHGQKSMETSKQLPWLSLLLGETDHLGQYLLLKNSTELRKFWNLLRKEKLKPEMFEGCSTGYVQIPFLFSLLDIDEEYHFETENVCGEHIALTILDDFVKCVGPVGRIERSRIVKSLVSEEQDDAEESSESCENAEIVRATGPTDDSALIAVQSATTPGTSETNYDDFARRFLTLENTDISVLHYMVLQYVEVSAVLYDNVEKRDYDAMPAAARSNIGLDITDPPPPANNIILEFLRDFIGRLSKVFESETPTESELAHVLKHKFLNSKSVDIFGPAWKMKCHNKMSSAESAHSGDTISIQALASLFEDGEKVVAQPEPESDLEKYLLNNSIELGKRLESQLKSLVLGNSSMQKSTNVEKESCDAMTPRREKNIATLAKYLTEGLTAFELLDLLIYGVKSADASATDDDVETLLIEGDKNLSPDDYPGLVKFHQMMKDVCCEGNMA